MPTKIAILLISALAVGVFQAPAAGALSLSGTRDCDANAVIYCGAMTTAELRQKFSQSEDVRRIYSHFGIRESHINSMESNVVAGQVTNSNTVIVNGQVVATDALTLGRQNMPGSTAISYRNGTFYKRPPSASFASSSLPAFVVMNNGKFAYAVIASCGNPVLAKPVARKQAPKASVQKVEEQVVVHQQVTQSVNVQPQPQPQPVVAYKTTPPPQQPVQQPAKELPKTGSESVLGMGAAAAAASGFAHYLYRRRFFVF